MNIIKNTVLYCLLFCVGTSYVTAQNYKAEQALVENKKVKKGVLPNGMTYYIYPTKVNKGTASYYIIQNVGSILENDNQKGLAHFLEHMAFNGTKNFQGKALLTTLEKQGAVFGQNVNAYTSFDETVYNFDNIPTSDPKVVDNCLLILHDWSHSLLLSSKEIDAERGVINEEWRTRQNASARITDKFKPFIYNHSLYMDRSPIGDMDIVKHFDYSLLRNFYKSWYRPDLQAIAVVGDVNTAEIEQKIKKLFSDIPAAKNPLKRLEITIPDHDKPFFIIAADKEISRSSISFMITQKKARQNNTYADLQESILRNMAFSLFNNRLDELSQKEDCVFKNANASYGSFTRLNDAFTINVSPKPGKQASAFESVMNEYARAVQFGFSQGEIQRAVASTISSYENYIETENEIPHKAIIQSVKGDYLSQEMFTEPRDEFDMVKEILKNLRPEMLQEELKKGYTPKNRVITVVGVENEKNLTQEEAFAIIANSEHNSHLTAYQDSFSGKSLLDDLTIVPGKIVSETESKEIGAVTFLLSNGVKVHYKYANKNIGDVQLFAESFGGSSLYEPKDIPSINALNMLVNASGLGTLNSIDLGKELTGKNAGSSVNIGGLKESVSGNAKVKDIETMFQLVHLSFVKPRFDAEIFNIIKSNMENALINKDNDIKGKMRDSLNAAVYGKDNLRVPVLNEQYISNTSFDRIKTIYQERFSDVSNFKFYITGDVSVVILRPLLEKYIAGINDVKRTENFRDNSISWTSDKIDKNVFMKMETPKSNVTIQFENDLTYSQKNVILANMLGDILTLRYTESLREKEGGTYGANVSASLSRLPKSKAVLSINFECDPNKDERLIGIAYQEIDKIKKGVLIQDDITKTKMNYLKMREDSKDFNSYSMNLMYEFFQNKINMDDPANFLLIVKDINKKDIQDFANLFLNSAKSYKVVFKPLL